MNTQTQTPSTPNIPSWATLPDRSYPYYAGSPRTYRFDGLTGEFWIGTERSLTELWIQPLCWQWQEGTRWSRANQEWLDLAFVDADHIVSTISLKKASAVNVQDYILRLEAGKIYPKGIRAEAVWIKLIPAPKITTSGDPFFVANIEEASFASEEQFKLAIEFWESGVFEWHFVGEVE